MSASRDAPELGELGQALFTALNACTNPDQLDGIMKRIWSEHHPSGAVTDGEAQYLAERIELRRPTSRHALAVRATVASPLDTADRVGALAATRWLSHVAVDHGVPTVGRLAGRLQRRFTPRKPQRSPDRKASRERRRMLGGSGCMPAKMGSMYTEGERAALCVISGEIKRQGSCDLSIDEIAARGGSMSNHGSERRS
jgi:hypothetical protein